jgi:hypothetical protein
MTEKGNLMNTKTQNPTISPYEYEEEEEDITVIRYIPGERIEGRLRPRIRPLVRWFGTLSTTILGIVALEPGLFGIPLHAQGWVFLIFILWLFAFCSGIFNL